MGHQHSSHGCYYYSLSFCLLSLLKYKLYRVCSVKWPQGDQKPTYLLVPTTFPVHTTFCILSLSAASQMTDAKYWSSKIAPTLNSGKCVLFWKGCPCTYVKTRTSLVGVNHTHNSKCPAEKEMEDKKLRCARRQEKSIDQTPPIASK